MISKLAIASIAGAACASGHLVKRDDGVFSDTLYKRDGGSHSHSAPPSSSYGAPEPSYSAPSPSYSAPAPSYSAPAPSYGAPEPSYSAPEPSYGAPEPSYGAPDTGYGAPSSGYGEASAGGLDLTSILIPLLALLGLSLLFPTYVNLTTVKRKKRSADGEMVDEDESPMSNMVERVQDMYMAVLQSEECLERVACEVGGLAEDAGISKSLTKASESFLPKKYSKMMNKFNHGKDCSKNNKCGLF